MSSDNDPSINVEMLTFNQFVMELNPADQYYLKAVDYYPFNFEFVIENLQYALSYDPEHTQSLCLMGRLFMYHMKEFEEAKVCFNRTLQSNINYPEAYKHLSKLHIWLGEFDRADKLIQFGKNIPGMNQIEMLRNEALMFECKGQFIRARSILKMARLKAISVQCRTDAKSDLSRVNEKIKMLKRRKKGLCSYIAQCSSIRCHVKCRHSISPYQT